MTRETLHPPPEWHRLREHWRALADTRLTALFEADPGRAERLSVEACGLLLDYSKNRITAETMGLLAALARATDLEGWRARLFAGDVVNASEARPALHAALRRSAPGPFPGPANDVMPAVREMRAAMREVAESIRGGRWAGSTGLPIDTVVSIGIGGSDLGPALVADALGPLGAGRVAVRFVSNVDGADLDEALADADPARTLFIVISKTFTTQETMLNASSAREWLLAGLAGAPDAIGRHFLAVSARPDRAAEFGIPPANVHGFWDWVGGRYSVWSAVGLPAAIRIGMDRFESFLAGASAMDEHFLEAPIERNMPVVLGLLGAWYRNCAGAPTHAVLPYDLALRRLPAYLQQLEMESNGKHVSRDGVPLSHDTCPIVWGGPANNGQHAFFQLLHQGTALVPCDFIVAARGRVEREAHQRAVLSNALAQSAALMRGRSVDEVRAELAAAGIPGPELEAAAAERASPGNRPSSTLLYDRLEPETLGALLALYEHKTFVQAVLWGINPFDQWGVELGKRIQGQVGEALDGGDASGLDPSTRRLLETLAHMRATR